MGTLFSPTVYMHIWYIPDTLVARAQCYVIWEELSVKPFLKRSNHWKPTLKMFEREPCASVTV